MDDQRPLVTRHLNYKRPRRFYRKLATHAGHVQPDPDRAVAALGEGDFIKFQGLDPALGSLGAVVGLLSEENPTPSNVPTLDTVWELNPTWFADPLGNIKTALETTPDALIQLITQLFGAVAGQAVGLPIRDPALVGTWYPLVTPADREGTGLFVVSYAAEIDGQERQVFGLGTLGQFAVPPADPVIQVEAFGLIPLLSLGEGGVKPVVTQPDFPVSLGVAVTGVAKSAEVGTDGTGGTGAEPAPLFDLDGVSFDGIKVNVDFDLAAANANANIIVQNLLLPGDDAAVNRNLSDLAKLSGRQIQDTVSALFVGALAQASETAAEEAGYILPVIGVSGAVPGHADTPLPQLAWADLFSLASSGGDVALPFKAWFTALTETPEMLGLWLTAIAGAAGRRGVSPTGAGTRADPVSVIIADLTKTDPAIGSLSFTMASVVDAAGVRQVYPGLAFATVAKALGTSDAVFRLIAGAELAQFSIGVGQFSVGAPSSLTFDIAMALTNADAAKPLVSYDDPGKGTFAAQSLNASIMLGGGLTPVPAMTVTQLKTPTGDFPSVDLLSPSDLTKVANDVLAPLIESGLKSLLGLDTPEGQTALQVATDTAALVGVIPPTGAGDQWPSDALAPPFSVAQIPATVTDPLGSMAAYYRNILTYSDEIAGKKAFTYMVEQLAALLQLADGAAASITVSGDGTPASPWSAGIAIKDTTLPAYLTAYTVQATAPGGPVTQLMTSLSLGPSFTVADVPVDIRVLVDLVQLDLPNAGSGAAQSGVWLPTLGAGLSLPDGFTTPEVAGATFSIGPSSFGGQFARLSGWGLDFEVGAPSLTIGSQTVSLGQALNLSDPKSLQELVTKGNTAFQTMITALAGVALIQASTRFGLATSGLFGLLKDLGNAPGFPKGLTWPDIEPISITDFSDPWAAIRTQLSRDLANTTNAGAVLSLLGWALDSTLTEAPTIPGSLDPLDPYRVAVKGAPFDLLVWSDTDTPGSRLGLGAGRPGTATVQVPGTGLNIKVDSLFRLNALELSLEDGSLILDGVAPGFSAVLSLSNADGGLLIDGKAAGSLESIDLGVQMALGSDGTLTVTPVLTLVNVTLPSESQATTLTYDEIFSADFAARSLQAVQQLMNMAVSEACKAASGSATFQQFYGLLGLVGLVMPRPRDTDPYGINPGGFQGLVANPQTYLATQFTALVSVPDQRQSLFDFLQGQLGITLPEIPTPFLDLLNALGILGPEDQGYPLHIETVVTWLRNPYGTLVARAETIFKSDTLRADLESRLADVASTLSVGPFTLAVVGGNQIRLAVDPNKAPLIGGVAKPAGTLVLDLATPGVTASTGAYFPDLGLGPKATVDVGFDAGGTPTTVFATVLAFGDGSRPAPDPLNLYPFNAQDFLNELAGLLPAYALSVLGSFTLQGQLLDKFPFMQQLLQGLGMAVKVGDTWQVPVLTGLFKDPAGWLMSNGVLGQNGQFDPAAFADWLAGLPAAQSPNGIAVAAVTGDGTTDPRGAKVTGLPYDLGVTLTTKNDTSSIVVTVDDKAVAGGSAQLDLLRLGVSLAANNSPGFIGEVRLETKSGATSPFFVDVAYDTAFGLTIGQPGAGPGDPDKLSLTLLPFAGFGSLLDQLKRQAPALVLQQAVPALLTGLEKAGAADFVAALREAGGKLKVDTLVSDITGADPFTLSNVEDAALGWLKTRLDATNAKDTAQAVADLLALQLGQQVKATDGLVTYVPSSSLPVTFMAGVDASGGTSLIGIWLDLALPDLGLIRPAVSRTGVGVPLSGDITPAFSFGASVTAAVEGDTGPKLLLSLVDGGNGSPALQLDFDPLGSAAPDAKPSDLQVQLLPDFFPGEGTLEQRVNTWLLQNLAFVVPRYIAAVVLSQDSVETWLNAPLFGTTVGGPAPGTVLSESDILVKHDPEKEGESPTYTLADVQALVTMDPLTFAGKFLRSLLSGELTVYTFGPKDEGKVIIGPNPADENAFGIRVAAPDLPLSTQKTIILQLGATDTGWISDAGGDPDKLKPGVAVYLPIPETDGTPAPEFGSLAVALNNLGLDFQGSDGTPLVNFSRFKLGSVSPRTVVDFSLNDAADSLTVGVSGAAKNIAISVAPSTLSGAGGNNPIAQNLLGAGADSGGGTSDDTNTSPTNPAFDVTVSYLKDLSVTLTENGKEANPIIIPIQRSFGPLNVDNIGVGWESKIERLDILFGGGINLAGLDAQVQQLTVGIPVTNPVEVDQYKIDLQGLQVNFNGGGVEIGGGLIKTGGTDDVPLSYTGNLLAKAGPYGLAVAASYTELPTTDDPTGPTAPSFFAFGVLDAPLGGVPAFFVTGVAFGFAVNSQIKPPPVDEVSSFPLLPANFAGGDEPLDTVAAKLSSVVTPTLGQYWIAAGLTFTSFKLIDGVVVGFFQFGREFEIDIVGVASAPLPKGLAAGKALAYVELGLLSVIKPEEGFISIEAQLTPNSYILAPDCKLTGGFAFYLWLKDLIAADGETPIPAGDFVISLGGYHPAFQAPSYYPYVPRVGLHWLIDVSISKVSINGGTYFALTPSSIMAGGYLSVLFEAGPLRATLNAQANFLIQWEPFYFNVDVGVSVSVGFKMTVFGVSVTISVSLGATLFLEGPPLNGKAKVDFYIVTFTIPIGSGKTETTDNKLDWSAFEQAFLPPAGEGQSSTAMLALKQGGQGVSADPVQRPQPIKMTVAVGRIGGDNNNSSDGDWVLQAVPFTLSVETVIPSSKVSFAGGSKTITGNTSKLGVRPMAQVSLTAPVTLSIVDAAGNPVDLEKRGFSLAGAFGAAPSALWSNEPLNLVRPPSGSGQLIGDTLLGALLKADQFVITESVPAFAISALKYDPAKNIFQLPFAIAPTYGPAAPFSQSMQDKALAILMQTVMAPAQIAKRNAAYATFRAANIVAPADPDLSVMASSADQVVQAPPYLARPGIFQAPLEQAAEVRRVPVRQAPVKADAASRGLKAQAPQLVGRSFHTRLETKGESTAPHPALKAPRDKTALRYKDMQDSLTGLRHVARRSNTDALVLRRGESQFWQLDDRVSHELDAVGGAGSRIVCFDRTGDVLADTRLAGEDGARRLPTGTRDLVLCSTTADSPEADSPETGRSEPKRQRGWQLDSPFVQVGHCYALGEDCLVRVANLPPVRHVSRIITRRARDAENLLADNRLRTADGRLVSGWVQTVFPGAVRQFSVIVDADEASAADSVTVRAAVDPVAGSTATVPLEATVIHTLEGGAQLLFECPAGGSPQDYTTIVVQPADGTRVLGVWTTETDAAKAANGSRRAAPVTEGHARLALRAAPASAASPLAGAKAADGHVEDGRAGEEVTA